MSPCRILVVEDHEFFRRVISSILQRRSDFQTVGEASDGLEAIHFAEKLQPDLVLLDIGLPKLNGLNATKLIRGVAPHVKILFLSQESSHEIARECVTQDLDIRCVYPAPSSHDGDQALEAICSEHGAVCSA